MTDNEAPKCIVCKSAINKGAKKCLACGSRQDFLRFFDVGNTSLGLLIAAFSVLALGADNFVKFANYFVDDERANFTVKLIAVSAKQMSVFVDNDGPGKAILTGYATCSILTTEPVEVASQSELPIEPAPDIQTGSDAVEVRHIYRFGGDGEANFGGGYTTPPPEVDGKTPRNGDGPMIIEPNRSQIYKVPYLWLETRPINPTLIDDGNVCEIPYFHENGKDEIYTQPLSKNDVVNFFRDSAPESELN